MTYDPTGFFVCVFFFFFFFFFVVVFLGGWGQCIVFRVFFFKNIAATSG